MGCCVVLVGIVASIKGLLYSTGGNCGVNEGAVV